MPNSYNNDDALESYALKCEKKYLKHVEALSDFTEKYKNYLQDSVDDPRVVKIMKLISDTCKKGKKAKNKIDIIIAFSEIKKISIDYISKFNETQVIQMIIQNKMSEQSAEHSQMMQIFSEKKKDDEDGYIIKIIHKLARADEELCFVKNIDEIINVFSKIKENIDLYNQYSNIGTRSSLFEFIAENKLVNRSQTESIDQFNELNESDEMNDDSDLFSEYFCETLDII